ncbi:MAG: pyridoxal-dependent decarboxylase [Polyangiaceae bacterium]|nr:pyridoxal-dependent decarboxylase [Polyangiaceae bacterium]
MATPDKHDSLKRATRMMTKRAVATIARRIAPERRDIPLSTWHLSRDAAGALYLGPVRLRDTLARIGSPIHLVDADALALNAARFSACPAGASRSCEVFCSYKTSPVPGILAHLHARGLGAEVVSPYELWLALRLGVPPEAIVYNGPAKSDASLISALDANVGLINVNARPEIARLASLASARGKRPNIGIRVVIPGAVGGQLGERIDTGAALRAYAEALRCPDLRVVALHSHFNHQITSAAEIEGFVSGILSFADQLHRRFGLDLEIIDVGGNLACPTVSPLGSRARRLAVTLGCEPTLRSPASVLSIDEYVTRVVHRIESHYVARRRPVPRIFIEPGRALTANAQMLLCSVAAVRDRDETGIRWAVLDLGIHVAEPLTSEVHQLFAMSAPEGARKQLYRLTGPSCMLSDQLYPAWRLPELAPGDGLAIMDTGAYFVAFSTPFSCPRPAVVMIDGALERVLRRAETFEDLIALDGIPHPQHRSSNHPRTATDPGSTFGVTT